MKFIASTTTLLKALQTIGGVIKASAVLPILENFLFELRNGTLTVLASDLEITMITDLKVESKDGGRFTIPAKLLLDTLKGLPEQPLTFKVDGKTQAVEITSETGRYKLSGQDADDFPKTPAPDAATEISIPAPVLGNALAKTMFSISVDDLRPAMTGVLFQISPEGMTFVSTNAHSLVKLSRSDIKGTTTQFIVPKKAVGLLKVALPSTDDTVRLSYNKSSAFFSFKGIQLITRLIDANFPDYNAVIPQNNPIAVSVNRLEFLYAMKRISLYSNNSTYQAVLTIAASEMKLRTENIDFNLEATERMSCTCEGSDIEIGFNARLVIDALTVLDSMDITINLSEPNRAGIFIPVENEENETILILIMPVMINA